MELYLSQSPTAGKNIIPSIGIVYCNESAVGLILDEVCKGDCWFSFLLRTHGAF